MSQDDYACCRLVVTANSQLTSHLTIESSSLLRKAVCHGLCTFLVDMPRIQSFDCSSPGLFLRVMFTMNRIGGYSNVSLWDKEQVSLLLTRKQHGP